jgi:hypothetical protein
MKTARSIAVAVVMSIMMSSMGMAATITWGSADISGSAGAFTYQTGWVVALYEDVDKDGWSSSLINSDGTTTSDDLWLGTTTTLIAGGKSGTYWLDTFSAPSGALALSDRVYSVVFNASAIGDATHYQVTTLSGQGNSWFELPGTEIDDTYTTQTVGDWQVVPEPGTMVLFGLGLMAIAAKTRKRKVA